MHNRTYYYVHVNKDLYMKQMNHGVVINLYHAEIYFFPISCATEVFFAKKSLFHHFSGFKKHYVAFFKKLILALGD